MKVRYLWYNRSRMDRTSFAESVQDALTNLYDRAYLAKHVLVTDLAEGCQPLAGDLLHRKLLDAIARLRPAPSSPKTSAGWRRYRYLDLRYQEGWSHKAVAHELGLSVRQAHRVRSEALEAVVEILEKRGANSRLVPERSATARASTVPSSARDPLVAQSTLDDEVARVGREEADSPADLTHEVRAALEIVAPLIAERRVQVQVDLPSENQTLSVGRGLLRQMLLLLLSYALEHADRQIYLVAEQSDGETNLDIVLVKPSDEVDPLAFSHDPQLTTAQRLVETQGGALAVIAGDEHRCLRLTLPPRKQFTVLVVDDNPDLGQLFDLYLGSSRYRLVRAKTAQSALRLAEEVHPDIVTLDVMMPFCDGWEVFRQLRANPSTRTMPVVVCSILPEKDLALALGANDFLAKPVTRQSLVTTLNRCLPP